ncbi:hypothetical protein V5O48_002763 [Marasmius crinis-equi]|uniref:Uncharacterized protein n=1 Tax=Marasmius crinis-equi TaxID=585013 RepID=A0ABR3FV58_9AGAR
MSPNTIFQSFLQPRDDDNKSPLSSTGLSSPLILVFMAMGVCSTAALSFFAWRRFLLAYNPAILQPRIHPNIVREIARTEALSTGTLGAKPVLFDLWSRNDRDPVVGWGQILPLSATALKGTGDQGRESKSPLSSSAEKSNKSSIPFTTVKDTGSPSSFTAGDTAQVALSIIFPQSGADRKTEDESKLGQYAIGVINLDISLRGAAE